MNENREMGGRAYKAITVMVDSYTDRNWHMRILLFALYWFLGLLMAIGACCVLGMAISTVIAILKSFVRPQNVLLAGGYLLMGVIAAIIVRGGFFVAGWVGDRTEYAGQTALLVGGIFSLSIVPQFAAVALKQTSGIDLQ